jgi:hypothetical protein
MFTQFKDVKNLKISEENMKEISFDCIYHDALLCRDRNVKIHIPKAFLNAKIIQNKDIKKLENHDITCNSIKCKLRLDFDLVSDTDVYGNNYYYTVSEIFDNN